MRAKTPIILATTAAILGLGGYFAYSVLATQGAGTLAQAPLNIEANIKPAFIMAVDDSNSMTFERLFAGGDGKMRWNTTNNSFFSSAGVFYDVGAPCTGNDTDCYVYLYPHNGYNDAYTPGEAIPPLDSLGFARSPAYNKTYFNPSVTYEPWLNGDGSSWPNATINAVRADPRNPTTYGTTGSTTSTKAYSVVYDLTQNRASTTEGFRMQAGMAIPDLSSRGMRYRTTANGNWTTSAATATNAVYYFDYFPATFYLPANDPAPTGYKTADANRPVVANACGPGCDLRRYEIKSANYNTSADYDAAIQNFANWFQYHRDRVLATIGSMTHALSDVSNMRVGYFTINNRVNATMDDMGVQSEKNALYAQIMGLYTSGGTPNRQAVAALGAQFARTDANAPVQLACQRNSGMLFTDGYTNSGNISTVGNTDGALSAPFADNYADTIADITAKYYSGTGVPLRSGTGFPAGKVKVPDQCATLDPTTAAYKRLDCQTNLHMNFYGITLGAAGRIYGVNSAATSDPYANPPNWNSLPNPTGVDDGTVIDEMWHATINSRGAFINASTPNEVTNAMRRVIDAARNGDSPSGGIGITGARIGAGSLTIVPEYSSTNNGTDWYSRLTGYRVATDATTGAVTFTNIWEASAQLGAATSRRIFRAKTSGTVTPNVSAFDSSSVTAADLCADSLALCTAGGVTNGIVGSGSKLSITIADAVNYLRGDQTLEATKLRTRTSRLGDIVNSTPVVSSPFIDFGYRSIRTTSGGTTTYPYQTSYAAFLTSKASTTSVVYAGANDGMLHAFNGDTGGELFAYIPSMVLGHMGNLLFPYDPARQGDQIARHKYYTDGPVTVADAYISGAWKTVLVGTAGAGGRGVFALDVTTPSSFGTGNVLWEVNSQVTTPSNVDGNMGFVLGRPVIVPVMDSTGVRWKAIFGNGYNSTNQRAVLFVVDLQTGAPTMITAQETGRSGIANGLGNIAVLDSWIGNTKGTAELSGRDGLADTVYAADQNGAIWKFDLRDNTVPSTPFFIATDPSGARQPILGGIEAGAGPGGVMVYFGTGSFSFESDKTDTQIQSFYGVNDRGSNVARSQLVRQTLTDNGAVRTMSANGGNAYGWYVDLGAISGTTVTATGERSVGYPRVENGVVFFATYQPTTAVDCDGDGTNRIYGVSAVSGASSMDSVRIGSLTGSTPAAGTNGFALNTGGSAPVKDIAVLSTPRQQPLASGATTAEQAAALAMRCSSIVQVAGAPPMYLPRACGRQSWRQVR
ncbi:pilus assembly protein [Cognatilysobacter terrigena]|uniref:pilus assembly protein n=1 Tax=Cognatilysobacter terrigena TaxID=2488749 RepID=UPI00105E3958|nr:PilC/PilY family type IV pilus protein [Lysobacter terrigena]